MPFPPPLDYQCILRFKRVLSPFPFFFHAAVTGLHRLWQIQSLLRRLWQIVFVQCTCDLRRMKCSTIN
ncbi:hypothetical protein C0J52_19604 [Blattella germanica]|nr:hypothetical protein C0J52_19604 [Blattella germanica]